jgi:hypothetical protein
MAEADAVADSNRFVGIFWAVQEQGSAAMLLEHRCSLEEAEPYGSMLTCPHGHYEVWEEWRKSSEAGQPGVASAIAVSEYEEWPRGRIVYDREGERFILYADAQILREPTLIAAIQEKFGLLFDRIDAKPDNHYRSTRRLKR